MVHIEKDQIVPENEDLRVFAVSGDYDDNDLIECYHTDNSNFALFAFPAAFIKYGGIVYRFGTPEEAGEALLKIDPNSTHDYAVLFKEEEARRKKRQGGDFDPENPVPVDERISQVAQDEAKIVEAAETTTLPETPASSPTPTPTPSSTPAPTVDATPSPSSAPSPSTTPTPAPSETPVSGETPVPTVTATSAPSETPTPIPSETSAPAPSETPAPTPSETPVPGETPALTPSPSATPESTLVE